MEQESTSFWIDIKKYEDTLAKDPQSYCFAPLAELYRKLGLLDDALNTAKRGCEIHPEYAGGYMALGRACFDKGLKSEAKVAFEKVVKVTPDNLMAQKLLSQIYIEEGYTAAAINALRIILSLNPADLESQVTIDSLSRTAETGVEQPTLPVAISAVEEQGGETASVMVEQLLDESLLEDDEVIEELTEEDFEEEELPRMEVAAATPAFEQQEAHPGEARDPLTTGTLAELYVSQGFLKRALTIYRELLDAEPDNLEVKKRMFDLKLTIDRDEANARYQVLSSFPEEEVETPAVAEMPAVLTEKIGVTDPRQQALDTLDTWLANIRRMR